MNDGNAPKGMGFMAGDEFAELVCVFASEWAASTLADEEHGTFEEVVAGVRQLQPV